MTPPLPKGRRLGGAPAAAGEPDPDEITASGGVLLASEEREFPRAAVTLAEQVAKRSGVPVHVFSIARIWGTTFGFPSPGLFPSKREWEQQRENVGKAVARLERRGVEADGRVVGTRAGAKRIVAEARRLGCDVIVMGADPIRSAWVRNFMWSQEPYRVRRRAKVPVLLVVDEAP